jgi:predicted nucleotidyltransferase
MFGIPSDTYQRICKIFETFSTIEKVIIYGSRALGTFTHGSDIDLCLIGEEITDDIILAVKLDIDSLNTPYFFDISVFHLVSSEQLINHIDTYGQIFFSKTIK